MIAKRADRWVLVIVLDKCNSYKYQSFLMEFDMVFAKKIAKVPSYFNFDPKFEIMNNSILKFSSLLIFFFIACGPSESERLEMEKKAADSVAAANAMMDAAKEAARVQAEERQRAIVDSLAKTTDSTMVSADTSSAKPAVKSKP